MTPFSLLLRLALALLLLVAFESHMDADTNTGSLSNALTPLIDFSGDIETPTAVELSETGGACTLPVVNINLVSPPSADCELTEAVNLTAVDPADDTSGPLFLLSVLALPLPSDVDQSIASPATSAAAPQQPDSLWLVVGVSTVIALIGASGALRFRRTSANR